MRIITGMRLLSIFEVLPAFAEPVEIEFQIITNKFRRTEENKVLAIFLGARMIYIIGHTGSHIELSLCHSCDFSLALDGLSYFLFL